jgi:hypothetical protein
MMTYLSNTSDHIEELSSPPPSSSSSSSESGIERRRGLRISQQRPIKVFEPTTSRYFPGQTADVSATGLRVQIPLSTPVWPGKTLSVHVGLSAAGGSLANRRQMIPARVVWADRDGSDGRTMTLGLEFLASIAVQRDAA